MTPISEIIFSGFVSKVVNDLVDVSKDKIRKAVENRAAKHQNLESQIYNVIVDVLNQTTGNQYEDNQDKIFDVAYTLLKLFKENKGDNLGNIQSCLRIFDLNADENECLEFKISLYEKLSRDEYSELFRAILLLLLEQKNQYDYIVYEQLNQKLDEVILILNQKKDDDKSNNTKKKIKSRTQEYANKWNENMFLNDFNERDENAGVNVTLRNVYLEDHLPHYRWKNNSKSEPEKDLKNLLFEYINQNDCKKMLLILGQPGIGKSTLITWITANYSNMIDDILVYQFASDLKKILWQNISGDYEIIDEILRGLQLSYEDLEGKILILDGFDEVNVGYDRESILNELYWKSIKESELKNFSIIITCRENYIQDLDMIECDYITLQAWSKRQIKSFCTEYQKQTGIDISKETMDNILKNKNILGIPLILYIVIALNIPIEKQGSIVDVYDQIFSLDGGIYDRCINYKRYEKSHRINEIKKQIHQISRKIAIWIFENNSEEACIPQEEYEKICIGVMQESKQENEKEGEKINQDFLIGNFVKLVKYCEGIEELYFVHRSIYEYFVAETIYNSIENAMLSLTVGSQEELAGNIAVYFRQGQITNTIGHYLGRKILKFYRRLEKDKKEIFFQWWEETVEKMMNVGMFYFTFHYVRNYENIIHYEVKCFMNLLKILRIIASLNKEKYIMRGTKQLERYIKYCCIEFGRFRKKEFLDFSKIYLANVNLEKINLDGTVLKDIYLCDANLNGASLYGANLYGAKLVKAKMRRSDLSGANLQHSDLSGANLQNANLSRSNLQEADLRGADLRGADLEYTKLIGAKFDNAKIENAAFDEEQVKYLEQKYSLQGTRVYIEKTNEIISYEEYCNRKK